MNRKTLPIFLAFLAMGFGDAVGPFVGLAKQEFNLSNTLAYLVPSVGFIMFGILSVPMGVFQARKGKKFVLLLGLIIMCLSMLIPLLGLTYGLFLLLVLLLGAGATILQVAGNPIMRDVSQEGKYSRNLSLGQFVKAIGSLSGSLIPAFAARWFGQSWTVIFTIYLVAIVITIISVITLNVEEKKYDDAEPVTLGSCLSLLKNPYVLMMVLGIFLYVGAEVSMSSGIPIYLNSEFNVDITEIGVLGTGLFFLCVMIGRFLGGVILNWVSAKTFFIITVAVSLIAILGLFAGNQAISIISVILIGLGFANIFPLIFSITVDAMPQKSNELSGLMITAIVGGAFIPLLMGVVADKTSVLTGFIVPLVAIAYVGYLALYNLKTVKVEA